MVSSLILLSGVLLARSFNIPQPGPDGQRLAQSLSNRGYAIDYGFIAAQNNSDPSQGPDVNYLAPNPTAIYAGVTMRPPFNLSQPTTPPSPAEAILPGYSSFVRAKSSEVFIIWLRTPPRDYFVFDTQLLYEKLRCLPNVFRKNWFPVATANTVPLDHETLNFTQNGSKTLNDALDKDLVLVISGDQNLAHAVIEELDGSNVNAVPFDMRGGVEGWDEDASVFVMFLRATYSSMHGASEMQRYMKRLHSTAVVMRATPTGEVAKPKHWDLKAPEASSVNEVALGYGRAIDEIRDNLSLLAGRLKQYVTLETSDVKNCPLSRTGVQPDHCVPLPLPGGILPCTPVINPLCLPGSTYNNWKYNCCKPGTYCPPGGELLSYYVHPATITLGPKDFVVAFGVNHVATGLSHYTSLSFYDDKSFLGMFGQTQREMVNSSVTFASSETVHFSYAFVYARDCVSVASLDAVLAAARCIEVSTGWPGLPLNTSGYVEERQYHVPPPAHDQFVHPSAVHFTLSDARPLIA